MHNKDADLTEWGSSTNATPLVTQLNPARAHGPVLPTAVQTIPPACTMENARKEFEMVVYPIVEELLQRTGIHPKQVGLTHARLEGSEVGVTARRHLGERTSVVRQPYAV